MSLLDRLLSRLGRYGATGLDRQERAVALDIETGVLDRLLGSLEASVGAFAICEVAKGQALMLKQMDLPLIHYVLKGTGTLRVKGEERELKFLPHCFIIVPANREHTIEADGAASQRVRAFESPVVVVDHMLRVSSGDGQPGAVITTCGTIGASFGGVGAFDALDQSMAVQLADDDPLRRTFEAMLDELASPRLGTRALTEALLKQCLILLIRRVATDPAAAKWLFGTVDLRLTYPVLAMIENPAHSFTLEGLARSAGMSRSSFAAHFQAAFATTPIDFLKRIRLRHAARLLRTTKLPIAVIARSVGYESRTYFSRAFSAEFGVEPRSFRTGEQSADTV